MPIEFFVPGKPQPGGSKKGFARGNHVSIVDANDNVKPWMTQVAFSAKEAYGGPLLEGPLSVTFVFFRLRPNGHFGTGKRQGCLKASAPIAPATKPDLLKLARAAEDALSGVIYKDDAQIVDEFLYGRYGAFPGLCVSIQAVSAVTVPKFACSMMGGQI
jgi:Holliday junction resolvase RusA-like endonuclease